jgi:hypothetical protein
VIAGDITDTEAGRRAVSGADAVISALGPSLDRKATGMPAVDGMRTIVEAMQAEGVAATSAWPRPACATREDVGLINWDTTAVSCPNRSRSCLARRRRRRLFGDRIPEEARVAATRPQRSRSSNAASRPDT